MTESVALRMPRWTRSSTAHDLLPRGREAHARRALRRTFLVSNPACACGRKATMVHHLVPVRVDPSRRLDPGNMVAVCYSCHQRVHRA